MRHGSWPRPVCGWFSSRPCLALRLTGPRSGWVMQKPVIGMTLRFDRIDNFWFVLRHEIEHVLREDRKVDANVVIDLDIGNETDGIAECEARANEAGADFCVPKGQLDDFVARVQPYFSEKKVLLFAQRIMCILASL